MAQPGSSRHGTSFDVQVLVLAIVLALILQIGAAFTSASTVEAARLSYPCGGLHCYASSEWDSYAYHGGETSILMVHLSCTPSVCYQTKTNWFVDNEMWLYGSNTLYDVEAGYSTYTSSTTNTRVDYFWAEYRPTYGYDETDLATVPSGDYGHYTQFQVYQDFPDDYLVAIYAYTAYYYGGNGSNSMTPHAVTIGQELYGTSGASAPTANFIDNGYFDSSGATHYYTTEGMPTNHQPPYGSWAIIPNSTNHGGEFQTHCC